MYVAFSIPNYPSLIEETPNQMPVLFVPNTKFILKFADGDLGIGKKIIEGFQLLVLSQIESRPVLEQYLKVSGIKLGGNLDQYFQDGKFIPPSTISAEPSVNNLGGLEAMERALIQSIFEQYKPYVEIVKIVIQNIVVIEDIVACILGLVGVSKKPSGNKRALGYQGPQAEGGVKKGLSFLSKVQSKPAPKNLLSNPNGPLNIIGITQSNKQDETTVPFPPPYLAITQSIVYSTGDFQPDVNYTYIYKDIFEEFNPEIGEEDTAIEPDDEIGKEEILVLSVFDSNFIPLQITDPKINNFLDWIKPKYQNNNWPQLKPGQDFDYLYTVNIGGIEKTNVGGPGTPTEVLGIPVDWKIKTYTESDSPTIKVNGEDKPLKAGQKAVALNSDKTRNLFDQYKAYYLDLAKRELDKTLGTASPTYTDEDGNVVNIRESTLADLTGKLSNYSGTGSVPTHVEGLLENNFMYQSILPGNTNGLPNSTFEGGKYFFTAYVNGQPQKQEFPGYAFKVKQNTKGVWVDPEAEYDMKIIKCDAIRDITFLENVQAPEKRAVIKRFIRKNLTIKTTSSIDRLSFFIKNPTNDSYKKFEDLSTATIDWYVDNPTVALPLNDKLLFSVVELGEIFEITNSQLPLFFYKKRLDDELNNYWYKTEFTKYKFTRTNDRNKLVGYLESVYKTFKKRTLVITTYSSKYEKSLVEGKFVIDTMELLVGSIAFNLLIQQYPNEEVLSTRVVEIPFTKEILDLNLSITTSTISDVVVKIDGQTLKEVEFNGKTTYLLLDGLNYYYLGEKKSTDFNSRVPSDGVIRTITYNLDGDTIINTVDDLVGNIVRIEDLSTGTAKSILISNSNITNNQLRTPDLFSKNEYGSPLTSESANDSQKQTVEQIYRFQKNIDDVETFYFVEAILKSKNNKPLLSPAAREASNNSGVGGGRGFSFGFYTKYSIFLVIPKFIKLIIKIAVKLFPVIQQFISLIKNPAKFITDIIIAKLGDDFGTEAPKFGYYSKEFFEQLSEYKQLLDEIRQNRTNFFKLEEARQKAKQYLNSSLLKNYVFSDDEGNGRFILDGSALLKLFGDAPILQGLPSLSFGIETNFSTLLAPVPQVPIKLIFSLRLPSKSSKTKGDLLGNTLDAITQQIQSSTLYNSNLSPKGPLYIKNEILSQAGGVQTIEEVSIQYSTGEFKEGVKYDYIYLTEDIEALIKEADSLIDVGDSESLNKAARLLEEALQKDPNNKLIKQKLEDLKKLKKVYTTQPLLDFMLNLVALPLKVIIGIIKFILNFFKSLLNPFELPVKIAEFVSFKWILDFFSPISKNSMFAMAGILFDIQSFFTVWLPSAAAGTKLSFDLNEIIKLPWATWPTYSLEEFRAIFKFPPIPIFILTSILCLIEKIINGVIDFIWSTLGLLDPQSGRWIILKPPYLKLCKNTNRRLSPKDIVELLSLSMPTLSGEAATASNPTKQDSDNSFNFIYDITTSDGKSVLELNQEELDKFMDENKDYDYTFNFGPPE